MADHDLLRKRLSLEESRAAALAELIEKWEGDTISVKLERKGQS